MTDSELEGHLERMSVFCDRSRASDYFHALIDQEVSGAVAPYLAVVEAGRSLDIRFGPHTNECEQVLREALASLDKAQKGDA